VVFETQTHTCRLQALFVAEHSAFEADIGEVPSWLFFKKRLIVESKVYTVDSGRMSPSRFMERAGVNSAMASSVFPATAHAVKIPGSVVRT